VIIAAWHRGVVIVVVRLQTMVLIRAMVLIQTTRTRKGVKNVKWGKGEVSRQAWWTINP
jgi:hypothetical protein